MLYLQNSKYEIDLFSCKLLHVHVSDYSVENYRTSSTEQYSTPQCRLSGADSYFIILVSRITTVDCAHTWAPWWMWFVFCLNKGLCIPIHFLSMQSKLLTVFLNLSLVDLAGFYVCVCTISNWPELFRIRKSRSFSSGILSMCQSSISRYLFFIDWLCKLAFQKWLFWSFW